MKPRKHRYSGSAGAQMSLANFANMEHETPKSDAEMLATPSQSDSAPVRPIGGADTQGSGPAQVTPIGGACYQGPSPMTLIDGIDTSTGQVSGNSAPEAEHEHVPSLHLKPGLRLQSRHSLNLQGLQAASP